MFWDYVTFVIVLIIGLVNIIWPQETVYIIWAVRHGVDDESRRSFEHLMRFIGIAIVIGCGIWLYLQF
ncbi:hypothetical protein N7548_00765 [Acholeplasma manati]|uniref:Uncharacterized protein n=1 Tax=Paracholeplasma manati TaxID=591373 RepID=A0ABT2Y4G2_9MOLU|nr:hypothetical protein [Paracholeplasma manati]MCV2231358.1 hypothetical protein [Paracholeplasma manati]